MIASVVTTGTSLGVTGKLVFADAVKSSDPELIYLLVVPAIPTLSDAPVPPLKGVSTTTDTSSTTALAGRVKLDTGDVLPNTIELVSVTALSEPPATDVQLVMPAPLVVSAKVLVPLSGGSVMLCAAVIPVAGRANV